MAEYLYNFKNISLIVGLFEIKGFADGDDCIAINYESPIINSVAGADGDAVASLINDNRANISVKLLQGSASNDIFSGFNVAYRTGTVVTTPFLLRDSYGRDLHVAPHVYVSSRPNAAYGQNQANREWILTALQLNSFVGGSRSFS
jgi:hypothetical protein